MCVEEGGGEGNEGAMAFHAAVSILCFSLFVQFNRGSQQSPRMTNHRRRFRLRPERIDVDMNYTIKSLLLGPVAVT